MSPRAAAVRLLVGIGVTDLSFRVSQVALPLVVLAGTGSIAATGLTAGASGLPVLLSPWWSRSLRHRIRGGRAVAVCYLGEASSLALVATAASLGALSLPLLLVAGLALGCAEALSGPGRDALVADVGDRLGDDRALGLLTLRDFFRRTSMVAGPAIGGLGVAAGHGVWLLWVEVMTILVSAMLAVSVPPVGRDIGDDEVAGTIWAAVRGRHEVMLGWIVRGAGCMLWFGFTLGLSLLGAERGRDGVFLATGMTAYGVGSIIGTLGVTRVLRMLPVLPAICVAWLVTGVCWVAMGLVPQVPVIAAAGFVAGVGVVLGNAGVTASITRTSAGPDRRTLLAGQSVVVNASSALGSLVGGTVLAALGAAPTLLVTGALTGTMAVGVLVLSAPRRPLRRSLDPGPARGLVAPSARRSPDRQRGCARA